MTSKIRAISSNQLETVVNSLFDYHLKEAIWRFTGGDSNLIIKNDGDKVSDVYLNLTGSEQKKLKTLYEVELDFAYKHCFICFFDNKTTSVSDISINQRIFEFKNKIKKINFRHLDKRLSEKSVIQLVFDHEWKYISWRDIPSSAGKRRKEEISEIRRHPIFLRVNVSSGRIIISWPGFQGGGEKYSSGGIIYSELISSILKIISDSLGLKILNINLKNIIMELSGTKSQKFAVKMLDSRYKELKLLLQNSSSKGKNILEELSEGLSQYLEIDSDKTYSAFENLIKNSLVDEASLSWKNKNIRTNLRFLDCGPEITFSWEDRGAKRTLKDQSEILDTLFLLSGHAVHEDEKIAWDYITKSADHKIIRANEIIQQTGCSAGIVKKAIIAALESGIIAPRYRLKSSVYIQDFDNSWKEKPQELKGKFLDSNGNVIQGEEIENIEIGFVKVEVTEQ